MIEKSVFVRCENHDIPMIIAYPDGQGPFPCILILHGFMSWKQGDGYMYIKAAEEFAKAGIATARIDFCSMGENRYSRVHYGTEICVTEAKASFEYLQTDPKIIPDRIGIMGHSMGGRITFLSSELPSKCLITLNGAVNVTKPGELKIKGIDMDEMERLGHAIVHTSDGRSELLFPKFVEDLQIHSDAIYQYKNPILVCIGADDPTLDPQIGYDFVEHCGMDNVEMLVIEKANHTFNAKTGDYTKVYELYDKVIAWLKEHL